jgi:hypothetical protein
MPPEELEGLLAGQQPPMFEDPFSMEFMQEAERTIEVSAIHAPKVKRARKVLTDKFVMHKDLKKRLLKLKSTDVPQIVKDMVDDLLSLKRVPEDSKYCNYLGLSQADYSKLSYLDEDRKNRLEGEETRMHMIRPGTIIKVHTARQRIWMGTQAIRTHTLTLTNRHLGGAVYPIKEFQTVTGVHIAAYFEDADILGSFEYSFESPILDAQSDDFRLRHSTLHGASNFVITPEGVTSTGNYPRVIGVEFERTEVVMPQVWNFKKRYHTSVGKLIRRLFKDKYSDRDITSFSEAYASLITVANPLYDFQIMEGEQVKWAYHEDNYHTFSNTLGSSCMRYDRCQSYFKMYTKDPSKVKMGVLLRSGKVAARAILWNLGNQWGYDRVYSTRTETENLLKSTLETAGYRRIWQAGGHHSIKIDLSDVLRFPYVDTLHCYHPDSQILSNYGEGHHFSFRSTGGDYYNNGVDEDNEVECICCGDVVDFDDSYYIDGGRHRGERCCQSCHVYSETTDITFTTDDNYVSTYEDDSVLISDSVQLFDGEYAYDGDSDLREYHNGTRFIRTIHPYELINGSFYHPDDENKPEETTEDYSEPLPTITVHPTQLTNTVTTSSNVIVSSSTFSTGTYSLSHPSQFSGYLDTPLTLGDIARALGEAIEVDENNLTIESLAEAVEQLSQHLPTESENTESPDQHLI